MAHKAARGVDWILSGFLKLPALAMAAPALYEGYAA
jgi:hypothetical protein